MELVAKVLERLNSPETPLWLKLLILAGLLVATTVWLLKPPHWADAEEPNLKSGERLARPPD